MMPARFTVILLGLTCFIIVSNAVPAQSGTTHFPEAWSHLSKAWNHLAHGGQPYSHGWHHFHQSSQQAPQSSQKFHQSSQHLAQSSQHFSQSASSFHLSASTTGSYTIVSSTPAISSAAASSSAAAGLNPNVANCQLALPANALTPEGLSTPWELLPPCSQAVGSQQAFAEAAVIDANGQISIYHPLIIDQGKTPQAAPVVPHLDGESQVALFFGFNGDVLTLVDHNGKDTNASPILKRLQCVNGLPGVQDDVFGQVSWCNTEPFWGAANAAVQNGLLRVPSLGDNDIGKPCLSARSFEIIDQDQSDNLPTKYLLLPDGGTVQFTAANKAKFTDATEIDNASDESLIADFVDPAIGCTPFQVDSIDDPGSKVSSLATNELQALFLQHEPVALIPLNNPDTLLTASGEQSFAKTNAYRIGVNQPVLGPGADTDDGSPIAYCDKMFKVQPPFLASFQHKFAAVKTPDPGIGNNLFTFLCNRFLQSIPNLGCQNPNIPIKCTLDGNGAATACTIGNHNNTASVSSSAAFSSAMHSQSSAVASSHGHSQSSTPASSAVHSQSSFATGTAVYSQSSLAASSARQRQSSGAVSSAADSQSSAPPSSAAHSQSCTDSKSAVPAFSSIPHGFGNFSGSASANRAREIRRVTSTKGRLGETIHPGSRNPWFA